MVRSTGIARYALGDISHATLGAGSHLTATRISRNFSESQTPKGRIYKPGTIQEVSDIEQLKKALSQDDKHVIVSFFTENCEEYGIEWIEGCTLEIFKAMYWDDRDWYKSEAKLYHEIREFCDSDQAPGGSNNRAGGIREDGCLRRHFRPVCGEGGTGPS